MSRISRRGHLRKEIMEMQDTVMQRDREELQTGGRGAQPGPGNGEVARTTESVLLCCTFRPHSRNERKRQTREEKTD